MTLARLAVIGADEADVLAFGSQIFIAVQQIADVELVFRLVVFQAKDLARLIAVGAEIAVTAGEAALDLHALGQGSLQRGKSRFPSVARRCAPIRFAAVSHGDGH